ncbi:MAG: guanylate kinase [Longimicrobiaceae bacterium]
MLLILCGPSGVGKSTLWLETAEELGFRRCVAYTTRAPRIGEVNGYDYHFVNIDEFRRGILSNEFVEWDFFYYNYYGFKTDLLETVLRGDHVVIQALSRIGYRLRRNLPNVVKLVSLQPADIQVLLERMRQRKYDSAEVTYRMHHVFEEHANSFYCDFIIEAAETTTVADAKRLLRRALESATH